MEIHIEGDGALPPGVTSKDIILAIIGKIGTAGATGYVVEYTGAPIRALSMEGRMTICNMSIEAGARAGLIAPDETTFGYLQGRQNAPKGADWDAALENWRTLQTDEGATYGRARRLDARRTGADGFVGHQPRPDFVDPRQRAVALGFRGTKPTPKPAPTHWITWV